MKKKNILILLGLIILFLCSGQLSAYEIVLEEDESIHCGTTQAQGVIDLGNPTGGRSIVWGGSTGLGHYTTIGSMYSSAALVLGKGIKLSQTDRKMLYSTGLSISKAGIHISDDISFFLKDRAEDSVGDEFDWQANTKLFIKRDGKIGIGTNDPSHKLTVNGEVYFYDLASSISADLESKAMNKFCFKLNSENAYGYVRGNDVQVILPASKQVGTASAPRYIQTYYADNIVHGNLYGNSYGLFGGSYAHKGGTIHGDSVSVYGQGAINVDGHVKGNLIGVYGNVYKSGGTVEGKRWAGYFNGNTYVNDNLGIGIVSPQEKLEVNGNIVTGINSHIYMRNSSNEKRSVLSLSGCDNGVRLSSPDYNLFINGDSNTKTEINYGGTGIVTFFRNKVIINPSGDLTAAGRIEADEVILASLSNAWADYVFEPDYKLMAINKLEEFVNSEKHLPGMPSEKEIKEENIGLGKMQGKLLEKIEELSLYIIQLKKENNEIKKRVRKLEQKLGS
ncbi:hypothetical protein ACFLZV_00940 [Candidatus Margulisiibacteriota bacterium]